MSNESGPPPGFPRPRTSGNDRRRNVVLRDLLDEMIQLARHLSHHSNGMSPSDLAYARERLEWLADEIWDQSTRPPDEDTAPGA